MCHAHARVGPRYRAARRHDPPHDEPGQSVPLYGYDRLLGTRVGGAAVCAVAEQRWGEMLALYSPYSPHIVSIPIAQALGKAKRVDPEYDTELTARETGISF